MRLLPALSWVALLSLPHVLGGCDNERAYKRQQEWDDLRFDAAKKAIEPCHKRGRSVIFSHWDGRMVDCR